jgi:hypothetical protein
MTNLPEEMPEALASSTPNSCQALTQYAASARSMVSSPGPAYSAALPLLPDDTASPSSRRLASGPKALATRATRLLPRGANLQAVVKYPRGVWQQRAS